MQELMKSNILNSLSSFALMPIKDHHSKNLCQLAKCLSNICKSVYTKVYSLNITRVKKDFRISKYLVWMMGHILVFCQ